MKTNYKDNLLCCECCEYYLSFCSGVEEFGICGEGLSSTQYDIIDEEIDKANREERYGGLRYACEHILERLVNENGVCDDFVER